MVHGGRAAREEKVPLISASNGERKTGSGRYIASIIPTHLRRCVWRHAIPREHVPHTFDVAHLSFPHTRPKSPDALWSDGDTGRGSGMDNAYIDIAQNTDGGMTKSALRLDQMSSWEKVATPSLPLPSSHPIRVSASCRVRNITSISFVFIILGTDIMSRVGLCGLICVVGDGGTG